MQEGSNFGPYQLIKRIAFGGMAEIHLAKATGIGGFEKLLALKVIHPKFSEDQEFIDMLVDEAKIAVQLSHVNVGQIFDLGQIDGIYYIAMEFIDGKDLYQLLVRCAELDIEIPYDIIAFIAMETAAGLQYAHTKSDNYGRALNLIHRDISPQNILISYDGEVKIVDFGIAKASQRSRETESGVIKGKFFYMSPEQAWGDDIDARTDIFSTGICLYEMIAGEMLYNEDKALALLDMVRRAEIPDMRVHRPDVPTQLQQITLKALAREKEDRYQSAGALQGGLSGFIYGNWPGFNRRRVSEFMKQVFGDNRFVLPMPAEVPKAKPVEMPVPDLSTGEGFMEADDFAVEHHSMIFDLNAVGGLESVGGVDVPEEDRTIASPYTGEDDLPDYLREVEEAEDERTIAEPVWSGLDDLDDEGERTMAMASIPEGLSNIVGGVEPPTNMYNAADLARAAPQPAAGQVMEQTRAMMSPGARAVPQPAAAPHGHMEQTRAMQAASPQPSPTPLGAAQPTPLAPPPGMQAAPVPVQPGMVPSNPGMQPPRPSNPGPVASSAPGVMPQPVVRSRASMPSLAPVESPSTISLARHNTRSGGFDAGALVKKIASPVGISVIVVLLVLAYGVFAFLPTLFADPPPTTATLIVKTTPEGARVYLNGEDTGQTTEARIPDLAIGIEHSIRMELNGYVTQDEVIEIKPSAIDPNAEGVPEVNRVYFLRRATRTLKVETVPPAAEVYVKGKYLGDTPLSKEDVGGGDEMVLMIRKQGFRDHSEKVEWGADTEKTVKVELEASKK